MIRLSPSSLNLFLECPRCFWLQINDRIHRPRGIFPSLPSGMDNVIKTYFDGYRAKKELPPEIKKEVQGKLMSDLNLLNQWRNWRTGLEYSDEALGVSLFGALDDCLQDGKEYIVLDYKTRGFPPKEGDSEKYYGNQLDCYSLLLEENGFPTKGIGYLGYYYPEKVYENAMMLELKRENISSVSQHPIKVLYDGEILGEYYADILVNGKVIIEIKASRALVEENEAQLLNYLKATDIEVGLLLNFGKKPEVRRKAYDNIRK